MCVNFIGKFEMSSVGFGMLETENQENTDQDQSNCSEKVEQLPESVEKKDQKAE